MTGIERIKKERAEQIHKHGFTLEKDAEFYKNGELLQAADFCLEQAKIKTGVQGFGQIDWPNGWDKYFRDKIYGKSVINQLTVCGAFILAEKDRTGEDDLDEDINRIASKINNLIGTMS